MDYLVLFQTVFYAVFSFAIFVLSILLIMVIYYLIGITRHLRKIAENADSLSGDVKKSLQDLIENLSKLPFISALFAKKDSDKKPSRKGRKK